MQRELRRRVFRPREHLSDGGGKVVDTGARDNDGIAAPVSFFGDAQEFSAIVLAELDVEMLAFDLKLFRLDNMVHLRRPECNGVR
jgi:hypothetical protein